MYTAHSPWEQVYTSGRIWHSLCLETHVRTGPEIQSSGRWCRVTPGTDDHPSCTAICPYHACTPVEHSYEGFTQNRTACAIPRTVPTVYQVLCTGLCPQHTPTEQMNALHCTKFPHLRNEGAYEDNYSTLITTSPGRVTSSSCILQLLQTVCIYSFSIKDWFLLNRPH